MSSFTLNNRASAKGTYCQESLYVRVIHQRKFLTLTTSYLLYLHKWDNKKKCLNLNKTDSFRLNYFHQLEHKISLYK